MNDSGDSQSNPFDARNIQKLQLTDCAPKCSTSKINLFASVGLRVSGSHDLGEIACEIVCNLMMLFADMLFVDMRYAH